MLGLSTDPYSVGFWAFVAVAVVVLVPLSGPRERKWGFAAVNLGFLALALGAAALEVVAAVGLAWASLRLIPRGRLGAATMAMGGAAVLGLFLVHKLASPGDYRVRPLTAVLTAVGFSYAALRLVDAARAVRAGLAPPPDPAMTLNYVLPFHMLSAGPIQSYEEFVAAQASPAPRPTTHGSLRALDRIAAGVFKKYVLAAFLDELFLAGPHGGAYYLLEIQLKYLWLFLDFSAYSDIAVGVGRLMGIETPENFDRPLLARNLIDFWDRWHITLSQFIRRNLFIPVQLALARRTGGARPLATASVSFLVSFLLCGLWHSVSVNWLAWGLIQGAGLIACNLYKAFLLRRLGRKGVARYMASPWPRALGIALTFECQAVALAAATYPLEGLLR